MTPMCGHQSATVKWQSDPRVAPAYWMHAGVLKEKYICSYLGNNNGYM